MKQKSTREKALEYWTSGRMKLCQHDSIEKYFKGNYFLTDDEIEQVYIAEMAEKGMEVEKLFSTKELKKICYEVFNMGMTLRQNQLAGYSGKSGKELLEEYLKNKL
jgi:hypothetical protein